MYLLVDLYEQPHHNYDIDQQQCPNCNTYFSTNDWISICSETKKLCCRWCAVIKNTIIKSS